ncbi:Hypothetical protein A7982_08445 [Minicystis rosea]|nr:Hypothetical protein A7982_08445 [Minicystis rosea]
MRKTIVATTLALAAFAVGSEAKAAGWGLHSGDTLRGGDNMLYGEVGWPDLSLGFQHGMSEKVDLGFRFSLNYGYDYTTLTHIGMGMRVPIRISPVKRGNFSFMIHFDPGVKFDSFGGNCGGLNGFYGCGLQFGIQIPFGLEFGIHFTREATLQFGMEMPIYVNLTNGVYGSIPILFGPGFEYAIDDHMAVGLNTKFGPSIRAVENYSGAAFGFITQLYFAYRL